MSMNLLITSDSP